MEKIDSSQWHRLSDVSPEKMTATCSQCGPDSPINYKNRGAGKRPRMACTATRRASNVRHYYQNTFGIDVSEKQALVEAQEGICAICPEAVDVQRGHLDHDHATGKLRGVLCANCNQGLGKFQDSPVLLHRAIAYLQFHSDQEHPLRRVSW